MLVVDHPAPADRSRFAFTCCLRSVRHLLSDRVEYALAHTMWHLDGLVRDVTGVVQTASGRLEVVAVVTLGRSGRTHAEAIVFALAQDHDQVRIVAVERAGIRVH